MSLIGHKKNIYSQNGEDGVLGEILRRLSIASGWFCEFGAWDGKYGSNTYSLLKQGWSGVMIEGDARRFEVLQRNARRFEGRLHAIQRYVDHHPSEDSLDSILAATPIPSDFEVLSIDIDGFDYQVWRCTEMYRPKIVIIEINSSLAPGREQIHGDAGQGSSFSSTLRLGVEKGYGLACHTGNLIFVRQDLMQALDLPADELANPELLFVDHWIDPTFVSTWARKIRNLSPQRIGVRLENMIRGTTD